MAFSKRFHQALFSFDEMSRSGIYKQFLFVISQPKLLKETFLGHLYRTKKPAF